MYTYQDFTDQRDRDAFIQTAVSEYKSNEIYKMALLADLYDRRRNKTICEFQKILYNINGVAMPDTNGTNTRLASNFFRRLNVQRTTYSLGNGVSFKDEGTKERFGPGFDKAIKSAGYFALIHGVSYLFLSDRVYLFKATEFCPFYDEQNGTLRAGIRFWQLEAGKPEYFVLYEEDGLTEYVKDDYGFRISKQKRAYIQKIAYSTAFGAETIGEENYSALPIVPVYGSELKQSTLVGMQQQIDSYDLIFSGFANDLTDCTSVYWLLTNYGGMTERDLQKFRERMMRLKIVEVDTTAGGSVQPYTQELPYQARKQYLDDIRAAIYEGFGGLDVHTIAAGATNDHIDAAYQPMDENADDFEYQIEQAIIQLGALLGMDEATAMPRFKRNRISNELEQVQMLTAEAAWLDSETIISKLPNVSVDEVATIMQRKEAEDLVRLGIS